MSQDISGIDADKRTRLHKVLRTWIRINCEMAEAWQGHDTPWWHNERASLSVLAGAVWRSGNIAYEEYAEEKLRKHHGRKRKAYSGRCDIFFQIGNTEYVAEAKQGWSGGSTDRDPAPRIQRYLRSARESASRLTAHGQKRLAIVFIAPGFQGSYRSDPEAMIRRWVAGVRAIPRWEKAWVFPPAARFIRSSSKCHWPGVAVFLRRVRRAVKERK